MYNPNFFTKLTNFKDCECYNNCICGETCNKCGSKSEKKSTCCKPGCECGSHCKCEGCKCCA